MGSARSATTQRRAFTFAIPGILALVVISGVLLSPAFPLETRQAASAGGLLLAGLTASLSCAWRAAQTTGHRRRSWLLFTWAGGVAIAANLWAAAVGADPVADPSLVGEFGLLLAMLLTIVGLVTFPSVRRRGTDLVLLSLDGLVMGLCALAVVTVVVYPELLAEPEQGLVRLPSLIFPVLDVVLATVAVLLLMRATGRDRASLAAIGVGFVIYAVTDLAFAVEAAQGDFEFGSLLDLGWIAGYSLVAVAAWVPSSIADQPPARGPDPLANTRGAALMFAAILAAGIVQVSQGEQLEGSRSALWLVIVLAAGARQSLLSADNASLRRGLERRVEEQTVDLRRLARENQVLLESVGDGIYGVDRDGRITFVNPSAARALGRTTAELLGSHAHREFHAEHPGPDGQPDDLCYVSAAISSGRVVTGIEDTYARAGGPAFPVEITASPVLDQDRPRGAVVVFRDVTQRREVERMKNEFLSVVSHELRTPLTAIRGSLGLLDGGAVGELGPRAASMVSMALQSSERLGRLINDLLDIERMQSGARPMEFSVVSASEVVADAVREIEGMAGPEQVRVVIGECNGRALGDRDQVMQTLTNLLANAIKFSEPGGVVTASSSQSDGMVLFQVRDQGRGIPADQLEAVFEPFAQVDSSDARQKGGTGLGLAISRSIVERHGGRIWAESSPGAGAIVQFTLPGAPV